MTYLVYKCRMCRACFSEQWHPDFGCGLYSAVTDRKLFKGHHCSADTWGLADLVGERKTELPRKPTIEEELGENPTTGTDYGHA